MSDTSSLTELARFVGQSHLVSDDARTTRLAVNDMIGRITSRPAKQRVSDLLAAVLTLSARTRRIVSPRVEIDLDVFGPGGERAVRLTLPQSDLA